MSELLVANDVVSKVSISDKDDVGNDIVSSVVVFSSDDAEYIAVSVIDDMEVSEISAAAEVDVTVSTVSVSVAEEYVELAAS